MILTGPYRTAAQDVGHPLYNTAIFELFKFQSTLNAEQSAARDFY